jgi:DNA invertase Pin-like site-specific DNA recombinase
MKTAVIYSRTSSSGYQQNRQDTSRQVEDLQAYAKLSQMEVVKVYEEHISGAKKNSEREVLNECLAFAETNHIDVILSSEGSRWGRSTWEVLETIKHCIDRHINVYLQKENIHVLREDGTVDPFMAVFISCLSMANEFERENIKYRLNSGRAQYIRNGGKLGRKPGSVKTKEQKEKQYKDVLMYLKKDYSIRVTAKLTNVSIATVQRLKNEFIRDMEG